MISKGPKPSRPLRRGLNLQWMPTTLKHTWQMIALVLSRKADPGKKHRFLLYLPGGLGLAGLGYMLTSMVTLYANFYHQPVQFVLPLAYLVLGHILPVYPEGLEFGDTYDDLNSYLRKMLASGIVISMGISIIQYFIG